MRALLVLAPLAVSLLAATGARGDSPAYEPSDAQRAAKGLVADCLARPWLAKATAKGGGKTPTLKLLESAGADAAAQTLGQALTQAIAGEKAVRLVTAADTGADFALLARVDVAVAQSAGRAITITQAALTVLDIADGRKLCVALQLKKQVVLEEGAELAAAWESWSDIESRLVAEELARELVAVPALATPDSAKRAPLVVLMAIANATGEAIPMPLFVGHLERALLVGGVELVATKAERELLRDERARQESSASDDTMKGPGHELGADFVLRGKIALSEKGSSAKAKVYETTLTLARLADNTAVWTGKRSVKMRLH